MAEVEFAHNERRPPCEAHAAREAHMCKRRHARIASMLCKKDCRLRRMKVQDVVTSMAKYRVVGARR